MLVGCVRGGVVGFTGGRGTPYVEAAPGIKDVVD
jgi:hypothetical protein